MQKPLQITLNDQNQITFEALVKTTSDTFIKVHEIQEELRPLLLEINHQQVNTLLELSKVSPFVLLYFDDSLNFTGASFSLNGFENPFGISTQSKKVLLLHFPISFQLEDVLCLNIMS